MKTWSVTLSEFAMKHLNAIKDATIRKKVFERIEKLAIAPDEQGEPLKYELVGCRSVRAIQRYRIVYRVEDDRVQVVVIAVGIRREGERSDIYQIAAKLLQSGQL